MDRRLHTVFLNAARCQAAALLLTLSSGAACAATISDRLHDLLNGARDGQEQFLDADQAFRFSAKATGPDSVQMEWAIADGYYLYRDKFRVKVISGGVQPEVPRLDLPEGETKSDESFGQVRILTGLVDLPLRFRRDAGKAVDIVLQVDYQGCKDQAICYPPISRQVNLTLPAALAGSAAGPPALSEDQALAQRLGQSGVAGNLFAFLVFGLLLSLTPCVFPMIPILSGIILRQDGTVTPRRGFALSFAYVLAMAICYAILGVIAATLNFNLQAASQNPWVLGVFSGLFVILALSMFGFFSLQLPQGLHARLDALNARQPAGTLRGAAAMGALSAIIVGPCVAPPLAGALLYISQTGNALLGGAALFALGMGFGVPLLILGVSAGSVLPRVGPWMESVKHVFGVIMLGVAIWFLGRVLPGPAVLMLWALLIIVSGIFMGALDRPERATRWSRLWKGVGLAMLVYGAVLIVGAASGSDDVLAPLARLGGSAAIAQPLPFRTVNNVDDLHRALRQASLAGKPVMLDFYADWCVTCKEMERETFPDPRVRDGLRDVVLLQADVTANDGAARALLDEFNLYGPPAILFFGADAREHRAHRLIGFVRADAFLAHLRDALNS